MNFPIGEYGVIYADPPWNFKTYSGKGRDRCPDARHYNVMDLAGIKALPVCEIAANDCMLFLWATDPMLPDALEVGRAWGFKYKTVAFYWAKTAVRKTGPNKNEIYSPMGNGYWTRANPEQCLLFTRGKPKRLCASVRRLVTSPRREHSRKPDRIRSDIEQLVAGPYVELFARQRRPGWDSWGNQLPEVTT